MKRIGKNLRLTIKRPSHPDPSRAYAWMILDGKREDMAEVDLTQDDLIQLIEDAGRILRILRQPR